jgi:hypothetical protein
LESAEAYLLHEIFLFSPWLLLKIIRESSPIVLDDFPDTLLTPQTKQVQNIDVTTGNIRNYFTTGKKLNRGPVV